MVVPVTTQNRHRERLRPVEMVSSDYRTAHGIVKPQASFLRFAILDDGEVEPERRGSAEFRRPSVPTVKFGGYYSRN